MRNRSEPSSETQGAVGLDVGGTKIAAALVALPSGRLLAERRVATRPERGGEAILADAVALAEELTAQAGNLGLESLGVGIGVAELVDPAGDVTSAHLIPWRGVPVRAAFSHLGPSVVDSDVRAAALAESELGAGAEFNPFAYLTVGTGIGLCLVQNGLPYTGARGSAGTLGYSPLSTICNHCGAALEPVLEQIAAGPGLVRRYEERRPGRADQGEEVVAAVADDPVAADVVESAAEALGTALGFVIDVLDPEAVVVGGGLGLSGGLYWERLLAATRAHIWSDTNRELPILRAALGGHAGVVGAALRVWGSR